MGSEMCIRDRDYLQYLKEHFSTAFGYYTQQGSLDKIRLFAQWGLITAENIDSLLEMAGEAKKQKSRAFCWNTSTPILRKRKNHLICKGGKP